MSKRSDAVKVVGEVAKNHQYTLLQDAYHGNDANFDFAYSKEVVSELAASGVRHYVIEVDKIGQSFIDKLASGEMSKQEFVDVFKGYNMHVSKADGKRIASDLADMVTHAKENGIEVHALDKTDTPMVSLYSDIQSMKAGSAEIGNMKVGQVKDNLEKYSKTDISKKDRVFVQRVLDGLEKLPSNTIVDKAIDDAVVKERVDGDRGLAERIKAATNGEKTAIMFGVQHGMNKDGSNGKDLDEHLGNDKVGKILLTPNREEYDAYVRNRGGAGRVRVACNNDIY